MAQRVYSVRALSNMQKNTFRVFTAAFLLIFYIIGNTQIGFVHQLFHPDEVAITHSDNQEKNPCHRSIYHGQETGCRHEFHLVKVNTCGASHTLAHVDQLLFPVDAPECIHITAIDSIQPDAGQQSDNELSRPSRGPPALLHT